MKDGIYTGKILLDLEGYLISDVIFGKSFVIMEAHEYASRYGN